MPSDCLWSPAAGIANPLPVPAPLRVPDDAIRRSAAILQKQGSKAVIFLGAQAMRVRGLAAAGRIAGKTGCRLVCETFPSRIERGAGRPAVEKLPYFPEQALELLSKYEAIVLAGALAPVAFFGYPNLPSSLIPDGCSSETLATPEQDTIMALEALADEVGAPAEALSGARLNRPPRPTGKLDSLTVGAALATLLPENCIVMDEAATTGLPFFAASTGAPPHTYLALTGGAIGQGLPCATGAAVACPERKVIAFQADGSGMYTVQALWTQARERLNVTTLVCNNRRYRILQVELARAGVTEPGRKARSLTSLANPEIEWARIAAGMGVPAVRVETAEALCMQLERALAEPGPNLIEMLI